MRFAKVHVVAEIDDLPMLAFDTSVVRAIVFNLVMNAIKLVEVAMRFD